MSPIPALSAITVLYLFTRYENLQETIQHKHVILNICFGTSYQAQH